MAWLDGAEDPLAELSTREARWLVHELRVHQVELEMQNEELRRTQLQLEEARAHYQELFEQAPVAYLRLDGEGTVVEANQRASRLLAVDHGQLEGRKLASFVRDEDVHRFHLYYRGLGGADEPADCELELALSNGSTVPVRLRADARPRSVGGGLRIAVLDVSDQRGAERARAELESRLAHSQKMEAVGTLASGVAHDFNNLLMGISGCASMLLHKLEPEAAHRVFAEEIKRSADDGAAIVQQLVDFSRKREAAASVFELSGVVMGASELLQRLLGEDIELVLEHDGQDSRVRSDAGQMLQVLVNLAANARDAMRGGGRLTMRTDGILFGDGDHPELPAGRYVRLLVTDSGSGMSEATRGRIFEPFFTTKGAGEGTGLGLAMVYGTVKRAGGHVHVHSMEGVGTTFEILLPLVPEPVTRSQPPPRPTGSATSGGTVLLVEDERTVRMTARYYLERHGYRVLEAASGAEAIEWCETFTGPIDVLLTDMVLPGMDGEEIARRVGALVPGVEVLYMSAHDEAWLADKGRLREGSRTLHKPFDEATLLARVGEAIAAHPAQLARGTGAARGRSHAPPPIASSTASRPRAHATPRGTVLVVEDSDAARLALCEFLGEEGWRALGARSAAEARARVRDHEGAIDVLLTDYRLPDGRGDALARELLAASPSTKVVYMTGAHSVELDPPGEVLYKPLEIDAISATLDAVVRARNEV